MRKLLSLLAATLFLTASPSFALVGGPWDNNVYGGNTDGIWSTIYRFKNGGGVGQFNSKLDPVGYFTTVNDTVIFVPFNFGSSSIFYKGQHYLGNSSGLVDYNTGTVAGTSFGQTQFDNPAAEANTTWQGKVDVDTRRYSGKGTGGFQVYEKVRAALEPDGSLPLSQIPVGNQYIIRERIEQRPIRVFGTRVQAFSTVTIIPVQ